MKFLLMMLIALSCAQTKYPDAWWENPLPLEERKEVIISHKTELKILHHEADTPFYYNGKRYTSVESFWQMMKFPDAELKNDPRKKISLPYTRDEVSLLSGPEAAKAGMLADNMMSELKIDWVTFEGEKMTYCSDKKDQHYFLIKEAMFKKYRYNYEVRRILLFTNNLILKPESLDKGCKAPEWDYSKLWINIREDMKRYRDGRWLAPGVQW